MPYVEGLTIRGWGVLRSDPWHLAGVFETEREALLCASQLGPEYVVGYGEGRSDADDFILNGPA